MAGTRYMNGALSALRGCEEIQSGPRWWSLRGEMEERGGGDVMTSLTTSDAQIAPQPPPARRVAGGTRPSASLRLLRDVPASPRRRASRLASSRPQRGPLWISSQPLSECHDIFDVIRSGLTAPCAADGLMTRPSPGLRPPS